MRFIKLTESNFNRTKESSVFLNPEYIVAIEYRKLENDTYIVTVNGNFCVEEGMEEVAELIQYGRRSKP